MPTPTEVKAAPGGKEPYSAPFSMPPLDAKSTSGAPTYFRLFADALVKDIHSCQGARIGFNRLMDRIDSFNNTKAKLQSKTQPPPHFETLKKLQAKVALTHKDYVVLAGLADESVKSLATNQSQTLLLAGLYTAVAVQKGAELLVSGAALAKGVTEFKDQFKTVLGIKDNVDAAANGLKAVGAARQGRREDSAKDSIKSLSMILDKVTSDTKSLASLVLAADKIRKGRGTDWRTFSTWLANISTALENLLLSLNLIYNVIKKSATDTRLKKFAPFIKPVTNFIEIIENGLKAKKEFADANATKGNASIATAHRNKLQLTNNTTIASTLLLQLFNENIRRMTKGIDDKTLSLTFVKNINNRADAKTWAKSITDQLARVQGALRNAKKAYASRLQEHKRDLMSLPYAVHNLRKAEKSMARNYRNMVKRFNFSQVKGPFDKITKEVARQAYWTGISARRYERYRQEVGQGSQGK